MVEFIIKSTISLGILYLCYALILRGIKSFKFNRYFLLFSLLFAVTIPFINIPIDFNSTSYLEFVKLPAIMGTDLLNENMLVESGQVNQMGINYFLLVYLIISAVLLTRFTLNLYRIINTIRTNPVVDKTSHKLVFIIENVLPHTFFNYILVNEHDYENERIDKTLIQHEIAHCNQLHSIDVMLVELLKIILWINPFVWLLKKELQLNHEFLADEEVLAENDIDDYSNVLVNLVIYNNTGILSTNFNFSLTKQRLKMMKMHFASKKAMINKIASVIVFALLGVSLSCQQETIAIQEDLVVDFQQEWWQPILEEHNIVRRASNNFENVFEMGSRNSIRDRIVTLENATIIVRKNEKWYVILKSPVATHDLNKEIINADNGTIDIYHLESDKGKSVQHHSFKTIKIRLKNEFMIEIDTTQNI